MIYFQVVHDRKLGRLIYDSNVQSALSGCISHMNKNLVGFCSISDLANVMLSETDVVVGTVEFLREAFYILKVDLPAIIPSVRSYTSTTLQSAIDDSIIAPVFVKPVTPKIFTGLVLNSKSELYHADVASLDHVSREEPVRVFPVFDYPIISEWRFYVENGNIVFGANYAGDFWNIPDRKLVDSWARDYKNQAVSFVIDACVLGDGSTQMVEMNDMWAIGNYGLDDQTYFKLLWKRYREIIRSSRRY